MFAQNMMTKPWNQPRWPDARAPVGPALSCRLIGIRREWPAHGKLGTDVLIALASLRSDSVPGLTTVPVNDSPIGQKQFATSTPLIFPARSHAKLKQLANVFILIGEAGQMRGVLRSFFCPGSSCLSPAESAPEASTATIRRRPQAPR